VRTDKESVVAWADHQIIEST